MPRYEFTSPGAAGYNALEEFLIRRDLQQRQAWLDKLAMKAEEDRRLERAARLKIDQDREARIAEDNAATRKALEDERRFRRATTISENALPGDPVDDATATLLREQGLGSSMQQAAVPGIVAPAPFMDPRMVPGIMDVSPEAHRTVARGGSKYLAARTAAEERAALAEENRKAREAEAEERRVWQGQQNEQNRQLQRIIAEGNQGLRRDATQAKADEKKKETEQKLNVVRRSAAETMSALEELADFKDDGTVLLKPGVEYLTGNPLTRAAQYWPGSDAANARASMDRLHGRLVVDLLGEMKAQSKTGATGFGALSATELRLLENAASKLKNPNISDTELAKELGRIMGYLRRVFDDPTATGSADGASDKSASAGSSAYQDYLRRRRAR